MNWGRGLLLVLGGVLLLVLIALCFPVHAEVHYKREGKDDRLHVGVRALLGLVRFGYDIPTVALMERGGKIGFKKEPTKQAPKGRRSWVTITVEKIEKAIRNIQDIRKKIGKYKRALRAFSKTFQVQSFRWDTMFGTGDAAQTAYVAGLAWGLKGIVGGMMYQYLTVKKRLQYNVRPHFQAKGFRTDLLLHIRIQPYKLMAAGLRLGLLLGKETWKQKRKQRRQRKKRN